MSNVFLKDVPTYVINLKRRVDRLEYLKEHFRQNGVNLYFIVDAVDGNNIENTTNLSNSELGCTMSHLLAIRSFYDSGHEFAMICEDDINLSNLNKIDFNFYDLLSLYHQDMYCLQLTVSTREDLPINFNVHGRSFWDFSTVGYIISREYAKKILSKYLVEDNFFIDNFISRSIIDYRGGIIDTRAVADELVYADTDVIVWPIFTFKDIGSNINFTDESFRQVSHSISLFKDNWGSKKNITIDDFQGIS